MKALVYDEVSGASKQWAWAWLTQSQPRKFSVKQVPIPEVGDDEILLKGALCATNPILTTLTHAVIICGFCGTDGHIHEGDFNPKFPVSGVVGEEGAS